MRTKLIVIILLLFACQIAFAGAGNDQPTNIVVTTPYSNNVSWAQVCWNTKNQSDSMLMIGANTDFSRQVYNSTLTTNHCVVVKNLATNAVILLFGSELHRSHRRQAMRQDRYQLEFRALAHEVPSFTTVTIHQRTDGLFGPCIWPQLRLSGRRDQRRHQPDADLRRLSQNYVMMVTDARIDGMSCLPGTLVRSYCGNTGMSLTMLCDGDRKESIRQPTIIPV